MSKGRVIIDWHSTSKTRPPVARPLLVSRQGEYGIARWDNVANLATGRLDEDLERLCEEWDWWADFEAMRSIGPDEVVPSLPHDYGIEEVAARMLVKLAEAVSRLNAAGKADDALSVQKMAAELEGMAYGLESAGVFDMSRFRMAFADLAPTLGEAG